jgi:hypothetical protein
LVPISAFGGAEVGDDPIIETSHAAIESRDGQRLRIVFAAEGQPAVLFKPTHSAWDWRDTSKLVIPVENPGGEPVTLLLLVNDDADRTLSGKVSIAPGTAGDLTLWIDAPSPLKLGMIAGPSLAAGGLEQHTLPVTATEGSIDASRVTSVRLGIARPTTPRELVIGPLRVTPPSEAERTAYRGIVDGFGQFHPGSWPEKVGSIQMLRAKGDEEAQQLARWLAQAPERDRFGGLVSGRAFHATGFFRTEQLDGRWWLVTPEGNPFFSIGMDVVAPSGATYVEGREFMFRDLPAREGPLAAHWSEADDRRGLGAQLGRSFDHGHVFDFYTANLERKFGVDWRARWREQTLARLEAWGFNTIGNWSDPGLWSMHRLPYTVPLYLEGEYAKLSSGEDWWGPMPDPFSPRFAAAADKMARDAAALFRGDPYLIGYFVDNELSWRGSSTNPQEYYALAVHALAAGSESPAKAAFVTYLIEAYREPERLGQAWGMPVTSWHMLRRPGFALPAAAFGNSAIINDLAAFSRRFAEAYFRTVAEALHRHDPDHLYLGSRFAWQTAEAVEACARWCDVVSFSIATGAQSPMIPLNGRSSMRSASPP